MDLRELERLLRAFKQGELDETEAARRISNLHFEDIGHARVDHARAERQGFPEVVFGAGERHAQGAAMRAAPRPRPPHKLATSTHAWPTRESGEYGTRAERDPPARIDTD